MSKQYENIVLSVMRNAIESRGVDAEAYFGNPQEVSAAKALEKRGVLALRLGGVAKFRGDGGKWRNVKEYYARLSPVYQKAGKLLSDLK